MQQARTLVLLETGFFDANALLRCRLLVQLSLFQGLPHSACGISRKPCGNVLRTMIHPATTPQTAV